MAKEKRKFIDLVFEKIPPLITWALIFFPIWGGFFYPNFTAYVILALNIYFLYKSISTTVLLLIGVIKLRESRVINWLNRLREFDDINNALQNLKAEKTLLLNKTTIVKSTEFSHDKLNQLVNKRLPKFVQKILIKLERRKAVNFINTEIYRLEQVHKTGLICNWNDLHHVVIIPHWKEPFHILRDTLLKLQKLNYPLNRISIVLGAEARDPDGMANSLKLKQEFEGTFEHIWVNNHELNDKEIIGKSSNMYSASVLAFKEIIKLGWDPKKTTFTSCDADSRIPADYFSNVSYFYVTTPDSEYKYYTGAVLLYANIWRLPFFARVKNSTSSLFNITKLVREDKLVPFSTYTLSAWMVNEIGFWSPEITPEDYHTFFKGLFKFPKKVSTIPIFQEIMADAAEGDTLLDTARNNYMQERRWAWGISDDGWMLKNVIKNIFSKRFNLRLIYITLHAVWDHLSIGISLLITFGGNLTVLVNPRFSYTVLGANLPSISTFLIQLTILFFVFTILLDRYIKPEPEGKKNAVKTIFSFIEWFLQPYIGIILVVLPGIEAHTRLLFGRYLEYYLTKKR